MLLKHRASITSTDLPYIESPLFAVINLNSSRYDPHSRVQNLGEMLYDKERLFATNCRKDEPQWRRLVARVENGEIVLVGNQFYPPFSPVFRKRVGGPVDLFDIEPDCGTGAAVLHLLPILLGVLAPRPAAAGGAAVANLETKVAEVASVRAAVADEQRHPLLATFNYVLPRTVYTQNTLSVRCKWEHEVTGRETRRTGPIKSSDAARNEMRFREMRVGDYQLEFKNDKKTLDEALSLRLIKAKRS